jgi:hypothetical protein
MCALNAALSTKSCPQSVHVESIGGCDEEEDVEVDAGVLGDCAGLLDVDEVEMLFFFLLAAAAATMAVAFCCCCCSCSCCC